LGFHIRPKGTQRTKPQPIDYASYLMRRLRRAMVEKHRRRWIVAGITEGGLQPARGFSLAMAGAAGLQPAYETG